MTTTPKNVFEWSKAYFQNEDRGLHKTRSVMAALMTYADFNDLTCYPSQQRLANVTGLSVDSVQRHLKVNVEAGWLRVLRKGNSRSTSSKYELVIPDNYPQHCGGLMGGLPAGLPSTPRKAAASTPRSTAALTTKELSKNYSLGTTRTHAGSHATPGLEWPGVGDGSSSPSTTTHVPTPRSNAGSSDTGSWGEPLDDSLSPLALLADAIRASDGGKIAASNAADVMRVSSADAKRMIRPAIDRGEFLLVPGEYGNYLELST
jgi:hypothetical protein